MRSHPPLIEIAGELNVRFPRSGYRVDSLSTVERHGGVVDLIADVSAKVSGEKKQLTLDDWGEEMDSCSNGPAAVEAFILLLHANLDERWASLP